MIDQDAPHDIRCDTEEVSAVAPRQIDADQPLIGLVHQCRGLQRVTLLLGAHAARGDLAQFPIKKDGQVFEGIPVAF